MVEKHSIALASVCRSMQSTERAAPHNMDLYGRVASVCVHILATSQHLDGPGGAISHGVSTQAGYSSTERNSLRMLTYPQGVGVFGGAVA